MKTGRPPRHGMTHMPIHRAWMRMIGRVSIAHPTNRYIERGIKVSKPWLTFENFFADMGDSFKEGLTLERIDNQKGYSRDNCKWATWREQANNRSTTIRAIIHGEEYSLAELARANDMAYPLVYRRYKKQGMNIIDALTAPKMTKSEAGRKAAKSPKHINNIKRSHARTKDQLS